MTPTVELDTAVPDAGGARATARPGRPATVYSRRERAVGTLAVTATALAALALAALIPDTTDGAVVAFALPAVPLLAASCAWARGARAAGAPEYRRFWGHWVCACALGLGAAVAGTASMAWAPLLEVDLALLVAAVPFWAAAGREALARSAGRLDPSVDVVDSLTAIVVLGAPSLLLLVEPLLRSGELTLAVPLAGFLVLGPAGLYGAVLGVSRIPPGERAPHGLGVALVTSFSVSVALLLVRLAGTDVPLALNVGAHVTNLAVAAALPLWSHRAVSGGLARLPVERQVRRGNPIPVLGAIVLPVLAVSILGWRRDDTAAVVALVAVLVTVAALNAVRQAMLTRETGRLAGELAQMAEERRRLLADMVRALDDDRRRIVSELHAQAVGSLSTLGTVVQTACVSMPASTAVAVRESIAQVQGDLSQRAEELRSLLVALRPLGPADPPGAAGDPPADALGPALRAYAADVGDALPAGARPCIVVEVDPGLDLDRRTATIAYRIAQEALLTAVLHSGAGTVTTRVLPDDESGGVAVEVADDGHGLDLGAAAGGGCLTSLELFTDLGHGELTIRAVPGSGTTVRSRLGARPPVDEPAAAGRHLRLV